MNTKVAAKHRQLVFPPIHTHYDYRGRLSINKELFFWVVPCTIEYYDIKTLLPFRTTTYTMHLEYVVQYFIFMFGQHKINK